MNVLCLLSNISILGQKKDFEHPRGPHDPRKDAEHPRACQRYAEVCNSNSECCSQNCVNGNCGAI